VDEWDKQIAVNLRHYFFACQKAGADDRWRIDHQLLLCQYLDRGRTAGYVSSNAGIIGLTRSLAGLGPCGIRVNAISPDSC
jgi:NAD(P)-dependent dehydrogenase (short-subunit alcohol dehydrogenase family)